MNFEESISNLRKRMVEAVSQGLVTEESKGFYETTLIQIMADAEKQRQRCNAQAEQLRLQASVADGQAAAFSMIGSIVHNVLSAFITQAERAKKEQEEQKEKHKEKQKEKR